MATGMKILTADRIGLGMVVLGMVGPGIGVPSLGLIGFGVVGPPLLREFGLLHDDDDFTRQAAHRAGFRTMLLVVTLLLANRILMMFESSLPAAFGQHDLYFPLEFLIQVSLGVFAISYVLEYWGTRLGVARVLVGVGVIVGLQAVRYLAQSAIWSPTLDAVYLLAVAGIIVFFAGLAWLVKEKPRAGGVTLLVLLVISGWMVGIQIASLDSLPEHVRNQGMFWATITGLVWALILFGALGVALLRDRELNGQGG